MENELLNQFNQGLLDLRETFHRNGRLDDSNTKLDEITKLLSLELAACYYKKSGIPSLESIINHHKCTDGIIKDINKALEKAANLDIFLNPSGDSLLGSNFKLSLPETDNEIAQKMASLIVDTFNGRMKSPDTPESFELINECFGHFIRDNFRNNIEDAQYMTPIEVVNFMCELALNEIAKSGTSFKKELVICDPSCGVGSFLAQFYKLWLHSNLAGKFKVVLVGQDKVDRMARLARINLLLFGIKQSIISRGNSLLKGSVLDKYHESCDFILTNPPFGARFRTTELSTHSGHFFPCLHELIQSTDSNLDSELLFIDRYISLLRPGGSAFVVVPDAIISANGTPALIRDYLVNTCTVESITELPAVTFAQAGTRTKTCILHFKKQKPNTQRRIIFSCVKSLGFEVASKKGVHYKRNEGENELLKISKAIGSRPNSENSGKSNILLSNPSCVSVPYVKLFSEPWTPSHHSATRYSTLAELDQKSLGGKFKLIRLKEAITLPNQHKKSARKSIDSKCISVLHVGDFGSLNIKELMEYSPKYPGQPCSPGDVLLSKINPRIPRVLVVPTLGCPLSCSTEFEVMRAKPPFTAYELMVLLLTSYAQSQIQSLTSGTSSSHNRIKTAQLLDILLPVPNAKGKSKLEYERFIENFKKSHLSLIQASIDLYKNWREIEGL